jgi:hypothetical protein
MRSLERTGCRGSLASLVSLPRSHVGRHTFSRTGVALVGDVTKGSTANQANLVERRLHWGSRVPNAGLNKEERLSSRRQRYREAEQQEAAYQDRSGPPVPTPNEVFATTIDEQDLLTDDAAALARLARDPEMRRA